MIQFSLGLILLILTITTGVALARDTFADVAKTAGATRPAQSAADAQWTTCHG